MVRTIGRRRCGPFRQEVRARIAEPAVSLTESEKAERGASCGSPGISMAITEADDLLLCEHCAGRQRVEGR
jgi:hypothetical protein